MVKICKKCSKVKNLSYFSKQKTGKFGVRSKCKECIRLERNLLLTDNFLLNRTCLNCSIKLNSLVPYKKFCNKKCQQQYHRKQFPGYNYSVNKRWKSANKNHINAVSREQYKKNPAKYIHKVRKRQAAKISSSIIGFDEEIREIYKKAKQLESSDGIPRFVHHKIPLREFNHLGIYGLHVPWNLEILTKKQHIKAHKLLRKRFHSASST